MPTWRERARRRRHASPCPAWIARTVSVGVTKIRHHFGSSPGERYGRAPAASSHSLCLASGSGLAAHAPASAMRWWTSRHGRWRRDLSSWRRAAVPDTTAAHDRGRSRHTPAARHFVCRPSCCTGDGKRLGRRPLPRAARRSPRTADASACAVGLQRIGAAWPRGMNLAR